MESATAPPISAISIADLPAVYRPSTQEQVLLLSERYVDQYVVTEFDLAKFEALEKWIWMAGRPYLPRPLNVQTVLGREIIPTNEIYLHLVWTSGRIFMKPIPRFLLAESFYKTHLKCTEDGSLYKNVLGFVYTYLALLPTELDFTLAKERKLLPASCDWETWQTVARWLLNEYPDKKINKHIPNRYKYGELRLSRLDKISRYLKGDLHHGYSALTGSTRYSDFLVKYLSPVAAAIAYIVVLLSAMQVGLATDLLGHNEMFQTLSVSFTIFALFTPVITVGAIIIVLVGLFLVNLLKSILISKRRTKEIHITTNSHRKFGNGSTSMEMYPIDRTA